MYLSDQEKEQIKAMIDRGEPLPPKYRLSLFADAPEVELVWQGKSQEVTNVVLPFQVIEQIDEPRSEKSGQVADLFSLDLQSGRQAGGWSNKLIWGDNKLVLSSLKNGPLRQEIEKAGGLKLIYIDPPFDIGADFSINVSVGEYDEVSKQPSVIEVIAYRDTWGQGADSYLAMIYERLKLMKDLLSDNGMIVVHVGDKVAATVRLVLDEVFGNENYRNTIIIQRGIKNVQAQFEDIRSLAVGHDVLLLYSKNKDVRVKKLSLPGVESSPGKWDTFWRGTNRPTMRYELFNQTPKTGQWRWSKERAKSSVENYKRFLKEKNEISLDDYYFDNLKKGEDLDFLRLGPDETVQYYVPPRDYKLASTLWVGIRTKGGITEYEHEKHEELLRLIIEWLSEKDDLVADFFSGSGTTLAVSEKTGRKWIGNDLGRFSIHTTRKRIIEVQREQKKSAQPYRSFEILNLGKYERQYFVGINPNLPETERKKQSLQKEEEYLKLILQAYKGERIQQLAPFHGKRGGVAVFVGPLDSPVTISQVQEIITSCKKLKLTKVDVLGFEFEMGLIETYKDEANRHGINLSLKYIPKDVFDRRAVEKNQVKFFDAAYSEVLPKVKGKTVTVFLKNFGVFYTQDDVEAVSESLKPGGSKVTVENGQVVKITKDKKGILKREVLTKKWTDWIDYWAVDFDYESRKEIIKEIDEKGIEKDVWTGGFIFENQWQAFRTEKERILEMESAEYEYTSKGKYQIAVKVIDIFGNDTTKIVEVKV